eukprot:10719211-Prorocentrum_lima.AAC.1
MENRLACLFLAFHAFSLPAKSESSRNRPKAAIREDKDTAGARKPVLRQQVVCVKEIEARNISP